MNLRPRADRRVTARARVRVGRRALAAVLLAVCCLTAGVAPTAAQTDGGPSSDAGDGADTEEPTEAAGTANATGEVGEPPIIRHAHPDTVADEDDPGMVEQYLLERLAERLDKSSVELEAGEYRTARGLVGSQYDEYLRRYVSVAGRAGRADAATTAAAFDRAGRDQRRFVGAVESYETTYDEYQAARDRGDPVETRQLARELDASADRAEAARVRLEADIPALEAASGEEFNATRRSVSTVGSDVAARQAAVREAEFVATTLSVERANVSGSYLDPIEVVVRLTDADGRPVADHEAAFDVGERRVTATTDGDGVAALRYRPTTAPVGAHTLAVRYVPPSTSPYFRSDTAVGVTVTQVTPSVAVGATPTVAFGVPLVVTGRVTVDPGNGSTPVPVTAVPVAIRLGERPLYADPDPAGTASNRTGDGTGAGVDTDVAAPTAGVESDPNGASLAPGNDTDPAANSSGLVVTDADGRFRLEAAVPVDVATGDHRVVATVPAGRSRLEVDPTAPLALATASGTSLVAVEPAAADLTVWGASFDPAAGVVSVRGRLTAVRGDPVPGVAVGVTFLGTALGESTTDVDGRFRGSYAVPASAADRAVSSGYDLVPVVAVAGGTGTNLEPTRSTPVYVALGDRQSRLPARGALLTAPDPTALLAAVGLGPETAPTVAAGVAALLLGVALAVRRRRRRRVVVDAATRGVDDRPWTARSGSGSGPVNRAASRPPTAASRAIVEALLAAADRARTDGDPDAATRYAYIAARRHLVDVLGIPDRITHREFAAAVGTRLPDDAAVAFAGLTDRFERTAFSESATDPSEAVKAMMAAREVIGTDLSARGAASGRGAVASDDERTSNDTDSD